MTDKPSLRDMKKEATAQALANAAFELALEQGLDSFVVEDVVQQAGYSRRTFANHFSCKEEAVAMGIVTFKGAEEIEHWLANLPASTHPLDMLYQLMKMQLTGEYLRKMHELVSLSKRYPTLEPYILSVLRHLQTAAQETILEWAHDRYPEGYTHLLAGAVYGAMLPLFDGTLNVLLPGQSEADHPGATSFEQYLDMTFGYLRNGF